jgi:hypothetical protein
MSFSIDTNDGRVVPNGGGVNVLMTMNEKLRSRPSDVAGETFKSLMNFPVSLVNSRRRVMGDEDVNCWNSPNEAGYLNLIKKMVSSWLVSPTTRETSESDAVNCVRLQVKVNNAVRKGAVWVMIPSNGKRVTWLVMGNGPANGSVIQVAARNENIDRTTFKRTEVRFFIGYGYDGHAMDSSLWGLHCLSKLHLSESDSPTVESTFCLVRLE